MQDRFKFRIFIKNEPNPKYNGMFKVHSLHFGTKKAIISAQYGNVSIKLDNNKTLMQCTGLKDKNGNLIYEGDVVKVVTQPNIVENIGIVKWDNKTVQFLRTANLINRNSLVSFWWNNTTEVIGNIYENPEFRYMTHKGEIMKKVKQALKQVEEVK